MFNLENIVRSNIKALVPYSSARDEFSGSAAVFLDANENPYGHLNRYPDPYQSKLKLKLSELKGLDESQIFLGNGSDEVIDLIYRIFCEPGIHKALTFTPTYGMYEVSAAINNIELQKLPLNSDFQINLSETLEIIKNPDLHLLFICSPNNPTGNSLERSDIEAILNQFNGIVIIDEAYIDFSPNLSWVQELNKYQNLIITQTLSKAWGLAGARIGVAYANPAIIKLLNKVKPPYNISTLNQEEAFAALSKPQQFVENLALIGAEKTKLITSLSILATVIKIYPSDANFILVEVTEANRIYDYLVEKKVIIRNRNAVVDNCVRITVGSSEENRMLIESLKNFRV